MDLWTSEVCCKNSHAPTKLERNDSAVFLALEAAFAERSHNVDYAKNPSHRLHVSAEIANPTLYHCLNGRDASSSHQRAAKPAVEVEQHSQLP